MAYSGGIGSPLTRKAATSTTTHPPAQICPALLCTPFKCSSGFDRLLSERETRLDLKGLDFRRLKIIIKHLICSRIFVLSFEVRLPKP